MRVLYQATRDRTLLDYCRSFLGFAETIELPHCVGPDSATTSASAAGTRSAATRGCWVAGGTRFPNLNDCICEDDLALHDLAREVGAIDALLAQYSVGSWLGNPEDARGAPPNRARASTSCAAKCAALAPRQTIPGASFFCFPPENLT